MEKSRRMVGDDEWQFIREVRYFGSVWPKTRRLDAPFC